MKSATFNKPVVGRFSCFKARPTFLQLKCGFVHTNCWIMHEKGQFGLKNEVLMLPKLA